MAQNRQEPTASPEQQIHAKENRQRTNPTDPTSPGFDKKIDGPNRPST